MITPVAGVCPVCAQPIPPGEGVPVRYGGRLIELRCEGCARRFLSDPERYLADHSPECCHEQTDSPASEWRCD